MFGIVKNKQRLTGTFFAFSTIQAWWGLHHWPLQPKDVDQISNDILGWFSGSFSLTVALWAFLLNHQFPHYNLGLKWIRGCAKTRLMKLTDVSVLNCEEPTKLIGHIAGTSYGETPCKLVQIVLWTKLSFGLGNPWSNNSGYLLQEQRRSILQLITQILLE